jgi:hypothetical protein
MSHSKKTRHDSLRGGEVFGRLTVVSYSHSVKRSDGVFGERVMNCKCECGKAMQVRTSNLRSGNTKSCGCLHSERTISANKERASFQGGAA